MQAAYGQGRARLFGATGADKDNSKNKRINNYELNHKNKYKQHKLIKKEDNFHII